MTQTRDLHTTTWLLRGASSLPGVLSLEGGRLSYTAYGPGNLWGFQLRTLERASGRAGLAEALREDETAVLFDVPLAEVERIVFPWYYFSGGLKLGARGARYRFSFVQPANTQVGSGVGGLQGIGAARRHGTAWRAALADR